MRSQTRPSGRSVRTSRLLLTLTLATATFAAAACQGGGSGGGGGGGQTQLQQFCDFWNESADTPPETDHAVLVKPDVVAFANDADVAGSSCLESNAEVNLDAAVLAEGEEVAAEQGTSSTETVAAVTGDEIGAEKPVLENIKLTALNARITAAGISVTGNVALRLSGTTSSLGFSGKVTNLKNWSVSISTSGLTIPGVTTSPVVFSGTLAVANGSPTLTMSASATTVQVGDVKVTGASINLTASKAAGVKASVSGSIKVGPSSASGTVNVEFDKAGALVSAHGDVNARLVGTMAGGQKIDLTGTVTFDGNSEETSVAFNASGILGALTIHEANGSLELTTNKATFVGKLDVEQGANYLRYDGSIVWDGVTAYTPFMVLEAGGEFSGTLNDGRVVSVSGDMSTTIVNGQVYAQVTGQFQVGTLKANGSALVTIDGTTTTLEVDASLVDAGFSGNLTGAVVMTDGRADLVQLDATVTGPLNLGDVAINGASMHIRSTYGNPLEFSFDGAISVGTRADVTGSLAGTFGPNGTLLTLEGSVNGSLALDSWGIVGFSGAVVVSPEQVALTGSGSLSTTNFPLGVSFNGTFTSSLTSPTWALNGSGKLQIASITVANARMNLSHTAGMKATRAGFYFSIIGIPTYFEGDFYMNPGGGCSKVNITQGSLLAKPILALALPGIIGCPVNI